MFLNRFRFLALLAFSLAAGSLFTTRLMKTENVHAQNKRVFELRTYRTLPGRLPALQARFRDHTTKLFQKHGMTNIGYWTPQDAPASENTFNFFSAPREPESRQNFLGRFPQRLRMATGAKSVRSRWQNRRQGRIR